MVLSQLGSQYILVRIDGIWEYHSSDTCQQLEEGRETWVRCYVPVISTIL